NILLIDDHALFREGLKFLLRSLDADKEGDPRLQSSIQPGRKTMNLGNKAVLVASALLSFSAMNSLAQAPAAAPPAVPGDVSPLYVVTYIESKATARDETAALLKSYKSASRA